MPLVPIPAAFDHPDWIFELKHDGFRALAHVDGHHCTFISRTGHVYKQFPMLADELAHSVRAGSCVLDGEIVCLGPDGRSQFNRLLFRRDCRPALKSVLTHLRGSASFPLLLGHCITSDGQCPHLCLATTCCLPLHS